jgi:hypothetical protein
MGNPPPGDSAAGGRPVLTECWEPEASPQVARRTRGSAALTKQHHPRAPEPSRIMKWASLFPRGIANPYGESCTGQCPDKRLKCVPSRDWSAAPAHNDNPFKFVPVKTRREGLGPPAISPTRLSQADLLCEGGLQKRQRVVMEKTSRLFPRLPLGAPDECV